MDGVSLHGSVSTRTSEGISNIVAASPRESKGDSNSSLMGVGKSDFLKLLVAQLRNQDPMKPMEDREFIAQMAQLNTVEQITTMNSKLGDILAFEAVAQASNFIGRAVEANADAGGTIRGTVQEVRLQEGQPVLIVDGQAVALQDVRRIGPSV